MNKYLLMLTAAGLIAAAPLYYGFTAHAGDQIGGVTLDETESITDTQVEAEQTVDCTKAALSGEPLPSECQNTEEASPAAAEDTPLLETEMAPAEAANE